MKLLLFFAAASVMVCSCVYDPPQKGISIFIENQTDEFLYIAPDSLQANSYLACYDTAVVNGQQYIIAKGSYIPPFSKYEYFLTTQHMKKLKDLKMEVQPLYIVPGKHCNAMTDSIIKNSLFKKAEIPYAKLDADSTYYLFVWKDKTSFTATFDRKK